MTAVPIYFGTPRAIVGYESENEVRLRSRLGNVSHRVWWCATELRDRNTGELWDTDDLMRMARVNARQLRRSFEQLRRFNLISKAERRVLEIRGKLQVFYVRKIYGQSARSFTGVAGIPARSAEILETNMGRGGARTGKGVGGYRAGAGRKPKCARTSADSVELTYTVWPRPVSVVGPIEVVDDGISKMGQPPQLPETGNPAESLKSDDGTDRALILNSLLSDLFLRFTQKEKPAVAGSDLSFSTDTSTVKPLPLGQRHPVAMGAQHPLVPREVFVGHEVPLRIPNPPKDLSKDLPGRRAYLLQRWLEGAYEHRTGKKYWGFRAEKVPHISQSKYYKALLESAELLFDLGIAPAAWAAWSVNVWLAFSKQGKRPVPVSWVFGPNRIREREGWFRSEQSDYSGGRLVYTDRARAFMRAQAEMRREFSGLSKDCSEAEIRSIVSKHFPSGFDQELQALKEETGILEAELLDSLTCGDWIWNPLARVDGKVWVWR